MEPEYAIEAAKRPLVLIVDDDPEFGTMLQIDLKNEGYGVICVGEAMTALRLVQETHPELIVTDINMPGVDGFSMVASLQQHPEFSQTPVIFVSGIAAGDYLPPPTSGPVRLALVRKPVEVEALNKLISHFIHREPNHPPL